MMKKLLSFLLFTTSAIQCWSEPPFYADKLDLSFYLGADGEPHAIRTQDDWRVRRDHTQANMRLVTGPIPSRENLSPPKMEILEEEIVSNYVRKKIRFLSEAGDWVPAYLLVPSGLKGKAPAALCLHPTSTYGKGQVVGLGDRANRNYAEELAERGYVTLAPDYPGFGDYPIDVYAMGYASATAKGIWNHMRAVDLLQSLPEVDAEKIACIGHSLGGHNSLFVSLFDERIKATVTSCGFCRFATYYKGDLTGWTHRGYMPRIANVYDKDPAKMPFDFPEILASIAPRSVFISAPERDSNFEVSGVRDSVAAAANIFELYGVKENLVAVHPNCEHDFPPETREAAYRFIDSTLGFAAPNHQASEPGYENLFDGETLSGWRAADMGFWSIEDGAITAKITEDHPTGRNHYLVWQGGKLGDFDLKLRHRIVSEHNVNGGFQFRSEMFDGDISDDCRGYQVDNNTQTPWLVRLYDEFGRHTLAWRGEQTEFDSQGERKTTAVEDAKGPAHFRLEDWHEYHLTCVGTKLTLRVDGRLVAEVLDNDPNQQDLAGILALQLHSGPSMTVQFRDIRLKRLDGQP